MGVVYQKAKDAGWIKSYPEESVRWEKALIEPGRPEATVKAAALTAEEADRLFLKLDMLTQTTQHEGIAYMVAEEADSILLLVRMVKTQSKADFYGILGAGKNLDIAWLRPKGVGGPLLNPAAATGKGLYGGTSGGVYSWQRAFTANTSDDVIPEQTMAEEAGVIHLGAIDPIEVPKLNMIKFTLAGIPAPAQSLPFNIRKGFGVEYLPFIRFEKPIIVGPERKQKVEVMPAITGDSKFQLLTLLVAKAESLEL